MLQRDIPIYIPTRGRAGRLRTLSAMPPGLYKRTTLLVPLGEIEAYDAVAPRGVSLKVAPDGIAATRQFAVDMTEKGLFIMLDDDLGFATRTDNSFQKSEPTEVAEAISWISMQLLRGYAWAGLSNRFMAVHKPLDYEIGNPSMAWGVNSGILKKRGVRFDAVQVCEDWHVCLSLLESGYPNIYTTRWVVTGSAQNKNGGCTDYRNAEVVRKSQNDFVALHPTTSKIQIVPPSRLQQGCEVGEALRVQWKKAYDGAWK